MYRPLVLFIALVIAGCGAAHLRTDQSPTSALPATAYIGRVSVTSQEEAAKTNSELQAKLRTWEVEARTRLQKGLTAKGYQVVAEPPSPTDATLTWNCDVDVKYGNRAMRYFVGFGAGSGHVNSTITAEDRVKETKYRSGADSDLAMGGLGGDIGAVLDANLDKLIGALPEPTR